MDAAAEITRHSVLAALSSHIGRERGVTARALVAEICGGETSLRLERDLRSAVEELRNEGTAIVATPSHGYFIAQDLDELHESISFLRKRALCSLRQIRQLKRLAGPDLAGQTRLRT